MWGTLDFSYIYWNSSSWGTQHCSYIYWNSFAWGMQHCSYTYWNNFAWGTQTIEENHFAYGVRYFTVPFPIYIGAILRGVHKIIPMIRTPCNIVPINIGIDLHRVHKFLLYIEENHSA